MNVVQLQCGGCPSASDPEAARLTALQHHVQELVDSAGRAGETARFAHEPGVPGCRVRVPARKVCEWEPASHFVQRREDVHADIVRNGVDGVLRGDRGRHRVARVPVPLAWNSARRGRRGSPRRLMGAVYQERGHLDDGSVEEKCCTDHVGHEQEASELPVKTEQNFAAECRCGGSREALSRGRSPPGASTPSPWEGPERRAAHQQHSGRRGVGLGIA